MADKSPDTVSGKSARLIARMRESRGGSLARSLEYVARLDPDFLEAYEKLFALSLLHKVSPAEGKQIPLKYREFIAIGILAFRGETARLGPHIKRALEDGASKAEVLEALEACIVPGGAPAFANGIAALMQLEDEEKARSK